MKILVLGDIMGPSGMKAIKERLPELIKDKEVDFVIVNGENAADDGVGITKKNLDDILAAGADVITSGNHICDQKETTEFIKSEKRDLWVKGLSDNIQISGLSNEDIVYDCEGAWAAVVYNTSACVIPIVKGVPIFTDRKDCIASPIANKLISRIEEPILMDRSQWFYDLAYCMWNKQEMKSLSLIHI